MNDTVHYAAQVLEQAGVTADSFFWLLLTDVRLQATALGQGLVGSSHSILNTLILTPSTKNSTRSYMMDFVTAELKQQVETLTKAKASYHFNASKASVDKIEKCDIARLSEGMEAAAPDVWNLLGSLLQPDPDVQQRRERARAKQDSDSELTSVDDVEMDDGEKSDESLDNNNDDLDENEDEENSVGAEM
ncbi:hypothetical protein NP233_g12580 [Leucocoprinus birnbaumii]|uniref:Uncharacterized protein n=1 Tax=Leucocoprinus birnbaumii TaxID=56174 RepID=A0AAD5YKB5_9AGAR|nr:hypothetical protein NP233_g12580 [Leucocoprinus birnbaumii]